MGQIGVKVWVYRGDIVTEATPEELARRSALMSTPVASSEDGAVDGAAAVAEAATPESDTPAEAEASAPETDAPAEVEAPAAETETPAAEDSPSAETEESGADENNE